MAEKDVSPGILEQMTQSIEANNANKRARNRLLVKADKGQAGYVDAYNYAGLRGKAAADAIREIEGSDLPNGKMYFNIANKSIRPVLEDTGEDVYSFSSKILENINEKSGIHLKPVLPDPEILEEKVKGILDLASSGEDWDEIREETAQTVENFSRKCVDDHIQANAERQHEAGLSAKVVRTAATGACQWCSDVSGTYTYDEVRGSGSEVWRRHANCDCVIEYEPVKGKHQTVSSRSYRQNKDSLSPEEREKRAERKLKDDEGPFKTWNFLHVKDTIKPRNIQNDLNKSEYGKNALRIINEKGISVRLCYGVDHTNGLLGEYSDGTIWVYVDETKTVHNTALIVLHEAKHAEINKPNTKDQELSCYLVELQHDGKEITESVIEEYRQFIDEKYPYLEWE